MLTCLRTGRIVAGKMGPFMIGRTLGHHRILENLAAGAGATRLNCDSRERAAGVCFWVERKLNPEILVKRKASR